MMVVTVFLAVSFAQHKRRHIRVEVLVKLLPASLQKVADVIQFALSAAVFVMIAWFTWPAAIHAFNVGEYAPGLIKFPLWPARFVLAFGATLMTVQCLFDMLGVVFKSFRVDPDDDMTDTWTQS